MLVCKDASCGLLICQSFLRIHHESWNTGLKGGGQHVLTTQPESPTDCFKTPPSVPLSSLKEFCYVIGWAKQVSSEPLNDAFRPTLVCGGRGQYILRLLCLWKPIRQRWCKFTRLSIRYSTEHQWKNVESNLLCSMDQRWIKRSFCINVSVLIPIHILQCKLWDYDETTTKPWRNHSCFIDKTTKPVDSIK